MATSGLPILVINIIPIHTCNTGHQISETGFKMSYIGLQISYIGLQIPYSEHQISNTEHYTIPINDY